MRENIKINAEKDKKSIDIFFCRWLLKLSWKDDALDKIHGLVEIYGLDEIQSHYCDKCVRLFVYTVKAA